MTSSPQKWPEDWLSHILQYCDLYFCDKDIKYLDRDFWGKSQKDKLKKTNSVNLKFQIADHHYLVNFKNDGGSHFVCNVFYKKMIDINSQDSNALHISCHTGSEFSLMEDIAGLGGPNLTLQYLMDFAENMMWVDHKNRRDDDWDNGDGENDPVEPSPPAGAVEPELMLN